jgi:hypothetical protein
MKFYSVGWTSDNEDALWYKWSRDNTLEGVFRAPFAEDEWTPSQAIRFEHGGPRSYGAVLRGGRLTETTRAELKKLWIVTQPETRWPRDTVGSFSILIDDMPLVAHRLKTAIEGFDDKLFEFMKVEAVWDTAHNCPLDGGPFYLANLLARIDSLDKQTSEIYSIPRFDGTSFNSVSSNRCFISEGAVQNASIWRDSVVAEVFCTDHFRELLEDAGCRGWCFNEARVSPG